MTRKTRASCLLADDHPALTATLSTYLSESGFEIVGPVPDGRRAVELARAARPQLALIDYRMPYLAGVALVRALREASSATRIAIYTADGDERLAASVLEAGASAVILKEAPLTELLPALETVLSGRTYVDPTLLRAESTRTRLTQRELDVLVLLAEGLPHAEIGVRLGISSETVRTHLRKASNRLGAATRTQAVATALRRGLIA